MKGVLLQLCYLLVLGSVAHALPLTPPIRAQAPENTEGGPPPPTSERWYTNADRSIWMYGETDFVAGKPAKVAWFRPAATDLKVSGRRTDGPAPPLHIKIGTGAQYRHRFTPSLMTFPTPGRWEIRAKTGKSELRLVIRVR